MTASVAQLIEAGMFLDDFHQFLALVPPVPAGIDDDEESLEPAGPLQLGTSRERVLHLSHPVSGPPRRTCRSRSARARSSRSWARTAPARRLWSSCFASSTSPQAVVSRGTGSDMRELDAATIHDEMTILFQDYVKYHLTALDNIVFGRIERRGRRRCCQRSAAEQTGADGFLRKLPNGYRNSARPSVRQGPRAVRWPMAAVGPRACVLPSGKPSHPRRTDGVVGRTCRARALHADAAARRRSVGCSHLAPILERPVCRSYLRARGRPDHRARFPRGADGAGRPLCRAVQPASRRLPEVERSARRRVPGRQYRVARLERREGRPVGRPSLLPPDRPQAVSFMPVLHRLRSARLMSWAYGPRRRGCVVRAWENVQTP